MFIYNDKKYKLKEGEILASCEGCVLLDECDKISDELEIVDYMICSCTEEYEEFFNPIVVECNE